MRIAIALVAALTASSTARADTPTRNPPALITFADRDDAHRFDELAAVTGVLYPAGAFIEQRICGIKRDRYVGCTHLLYGKQEGGTNKGNVVFDLFATTGMVFRRGRFDLTPAVGASMLTTTIFIGLLFATPWTREVPDPRVVYAMLPFEVTGNVALGYTFAKAGRFRARAELAVRAHVPLFKDSTVELPSPHGVGTTLGVGAGF